LYIDDFFENWEVSIVPAEMQCAFSTFHHVYSHPTSTILRSE
jgi:hypothetical protein